MLIMEDDNHNKNLEISVTFFDGESEIDIGNVQITPNITFKILQSILSNKIGISPNQITIYIDFYNDDVGFNHRRRRRPVTSKFDISVLKLGECFLWVILKRGRRSRRRRNNIVDCGPGPVVLLRRGLNDHDWEVFNRLRMIEEKERYIMSLNLNSNVYNELSGYGPNYNQFNTNYLDNYNYNNQSNSNSNYSDDYYYYGDEFDAETSSSNERAVVFCEVCYNYSNGDTVPFHCCKNDVVTTGFRSVVGPIAPPPKNRLSWG